MSKTTAGGRIVLVAVARDTRDAPGRRLRAIGYELRPATPGRPGPGGGEPDLVLLDLAGPGGDRHPAAQRLRRNLRSMAIPVVLVTAGHPLRPRELAAEASAAGLVLQRYLDAALLDFLERALAL